jgi:hypothetical protein
MNDPHQLTFLYTTNPDGWVTAQISEFPAAISEGATEHEAYLNVLEAFHDLTHEPTLAERVAFAAQARIVEPLEALSTGTLSNLGEFLGRLIGTATRDRVH